MSLDHGRSRRKISPGKSSRTECAGKGFGCRAVVYPILRKVREGWGTRSFLHVSHTQVPIRIHSRGRISTALTRCACRNVRTKRTKLTKSGFGRHFLPRRDDLSAYVVRIRERPVGHPAFLSSWPGIARADIRCVAFLELSKLLNQEVALSAPWLRDDFCSPQAHPCCGKAYPSL